MGMALCLGPIRGYWTAAMQDAEYDFPRTSHRRSSENFSTFLTVGEKGAGLAAFEPPSQLCAENRTEAARIAVLRGLLELP